MEPWQSWVLTVALSAALYYYYFGQHGKKSTARPARVQPAAAEETTARPARKREEAKPKRKTDAAAATGSDAAPRAEKSNDAKNRNKKKEQQAATKAPTVVAQPDFDDEKDNDKEWARQLADLKKGTSLAPPERKDGGRGKTVKQRAADADRAFTSGSSTNGADADAELSPAISPSLKAASGRDVADMLEAPGAGPSVLRLTEPTNPIPAKKPQQKKAAAEPKESKKQRQNRKKVEQAKALREEAEQQRKVAMEAQRRGAREARGEPAKNGLGGPTSAPHAWTQKDAVKANGNGNGNGPLLDTFEPENLAASSTSAGWERELPSEEEQMRLAMEDSGWNTVETKGKRSKKKTGKEGESETETYAVKTPEVRSLPLTETTNTSRSNTMSTDNEPANGLAASADISYLAGSVGSHPQDSDWAVV